MILYLNVGFNFYFCSFYFVIPHKMSQETWWNACTQSETLVKNEKYGSCLKLLTILFLPF